MACCKTMQRKLEHRCGSHDKWSCPDTLLAEFGDGTVGIIIKDGGTSISAIDYCPWCGLAIASAATTEEP